MKHPRAVRSLLIAGMMGAVGLHGLVPASASSASDESCFVSAINSARSSAGVAPLFLQGDLLRIARGWSQTMASGGQLYHNNNLTSLAPSSWQALGENVGMGPSCDAIAQAFLHSPEHRKNILDPAFTTVGVGVVDAADGTVWVTEDFMGTGTTPITSVAASPIPSPKVTTSPRPATPEPRVTTPAPKVPVPTPFPTRTEPATPKPRPSTPAPSPSHAATGKPTPGPAVTPVPVATPILDPPPATATDRHAEVAPAVAPTVATVAAPTVAPAAAPAGHAHGVFSAIASLFSHLF